MISRAIKLILPALLLAGCATEVEQPAYPPAPPPMIAPPPPPGGINGHGALRLNSGTRATCAGFSVALMPDIARYRDRIGALYGSTAPTMEPVSAVKARSAKLPPSPDTAPIATASCNAEGEFAFPTLAAGDYFLIAHVKVRPAPAGRDDYVILNPVRVEPARISDVFLAP